MISWLPYQKHYFRTKWLKRATKVWPCRTDETNPSRNVESGTQSRICQTAGFRFIYSHERISFTEINVKISSYDRFSRHCTVDKATLSSIRALPRAWNHFLTSHYHMWAWYYERIRRLRQLFEVKDKFVLSGSRLTTKSVQTS